MRLTFLLPFALIGLVGCVHAETTPSPPRASNTVVTPAPAAATSTRVIRRFGPEAAEWSTPMPCGL